MIESVDQLIEKANLIESESERVKFVMNYFLDTVQYDYAYLVASGYMQETLSELEPFDKKNDLISNPFKKGKFTVQINGENQEFDDSFCFTRRIAKGESKLLNKIVALSNNCNGDINVFYSELFTILSDTLKKHLSNDEIVKLNISSLISKIKQDMGRGNFVKTSDKQYFVSNDIKRVLLNYMINRSKYFPPKEENGLLKKGVCEHFASYLQDFLPKIGIDAVRIDGIGELQHSWIAAIIDGKLRSIDLSRALNVKDGFRGIPPEQKSSDWLIADFKDVFDMQKTRCIKAVGIDEQGEPIKIPQVINGDNYNEETLMEYVINQCEKKQHKNV